MFVINAQNLSFAVPAHYIIEAYKNLPPEELWTEGAYCCACGKMNDKGIKYCKYCGDDIQVDKFSEVIYEDTGYCFKCQNQNPWDAEYCEKCGAKLIRKEDKTKKPGKKEDIITADTVITCPDCGQENKGKKYCEKCGAKLSIETDKKNQGKKEEDIPEDMVITCPGCGHENKGKKHCTKCGAKLSPPDTQK